MGLVSQLGFNDTFGTNRLNRATKIILVKRFMVVRNLLKS